MGIFFLIAPFPDLCLLVPFFEKGGPDGLNKSQLFALCSMVENFVSTPFLYLLVVQEASLKDGVFKFIVSCALDTVLVIKIKEISKIALR